MQMNRNSKSSASNDESVKFAVAIYLIRSKLRLNQNQSTQPSFESDALRWRQKAKERKQELIRLRKDLRKAEALRSMEMPLIVGSTTFLVGDFSDNETEGKE
ncbi:hypothetical protein Patl1_14545 [Pistacia atlantica]|uniref:Uncharacterized protein n=1 Tax=Pistacia atlantica TaxID=434234 RepID=A0ACC1AU48_9ROSI|nr:hypothetical protein Patl1_14545 [Pistacia atlantica]